MVCQNPERSILDQETFPLPDSIYDSNFRTWAQDLDRQSQMQLEKEMMAWFIGGMKDPTTEVYRRFQGNRMLKDHFDSFIGNLVRDKGKSNIFTRV